MARVRERLVALDLDALALSVGADLPWLTGYEAMPLERLTMLVVPREGEATLVVPELEAPRVVEVPEVFSIVPWSETEDPIALVIDRLDGARRVAIGDHTWARFVLALQERMPSVSWSTALALTAPLRAVKDSDEIEALRAAAHAVDAIAESMRSETFGGRTERDVHRVLVERMLDAGHQRANFAIVATGPNAASPHHEPGTRVIADGDPVLCDFGGSMNGYCSDITRMYSVGEPPSEVRDAYDALVEAQESGVRAAIVGAPAESVDAAARAALGEWSPHFVHRLGHGIGVDAHEDPYLVAGNSQTLLAGNVFSIEPGVYLAGRFGLRLEDIVAATADGPVRLNEARRDLAIVV